ncbi:hypothetical protein SETIT_8G218700v2 [Setaria italica]|uniref:Kazal-like domain-containing protein n=1 Tax=Setaria italica TaxID=4555 RepID=K3ZKF2_SETIT|nr:hypothetical protein SETIT_8G218700v2 [Setaria italica]
MSSASGALLRKVIHVAACTVLVLLSMGPPAMADMNDDCAAICRPACDGFTSEVCGSLNGTLPVLGNIGFFYTTCKVRVSSACRTLCFNVCTLNTLTPAPGSTAAPPP